jgi:hypothetical protein
MNRAAISTPHQGNPIASWIESNVSVIGSLLGRFELWFLQSESPYGGDAHEVS